MDARGLSRSRTPNVARVSSARPLRVLHLADGLDNGGLERQLTLLATNLPAAYECLVWSPRHGPYADALRDAGVTVHLTPRCCAYDPSATLRLWRLVRDWRPAIVHTWGWRCSMEVAPACAALRVPMLHGAIRSGIATHGAIWLPRYSVWAARRVIANSRAGLAAWRVSPDRGAVVYNGFDATRVVPQAGSGEDASRRRPLRVVMTGRMSGHKDYASVIGAARQLVASGEEGWSFALIGNGPERVRLQSAAAQDSMAGAIRLPEPGLEVMGEVCSADVGVLMTDPRSHAEGCSNSIMEYMAAGLPVVCSDSGGNRELVVDGVTGFIIRPRDVDALVERLRFLRDSPVERARMGAAGRQRVLADFSVDRMVAAYVQLYEDLCDRGGAGIL